MKIGSLVEFIGTVDSTCDYIINYRPPIKGEVYTIRELLTSPSGKAVLRIEEFSFGIHKTNGVEISGEVEDFREIEFPPSIEAEIKECLTREFELV